MYPFLYSVLCIFYRTFVPLSTTLSDSLAHSFLASIHFNGYLLSHEILGNIFSDRRDDMFNFKYKKRLKRITDALEKLGVAGLALAIFQQKYDYAWAAVGALVVSVILTLEDD